MRKLLSLLKCYRHLYRKKILYKEINKLEIVDAGDISVNNHIYPFIQMKNGTRLLGQSPGVLDSFLFKQAPKDLNPKITERSFRLAVDVLLRYEYPHALPTLVLPYTRWQRRGCHPQHQETVYDLPNISNKERDEILDVFSPRIGESFLDIGSYMGFGSVRMRQELGPNSKIIAVEADARAYKLLLNNFDINNMHENICLNYAVSSESLKKIPFYQGLFQANSLMKDIVKSSNNLDAVETITVDKILSEYSPKGVDFISMTINGAELEAVNGMHETLHSNQKLRLSIAGWYRRGGVRICDIIAPKLRAYGFRVYVGRLGGILAWR